MFEWSSMKHALQRRSVENNFKPPIYNSYTNIRDSSKFDSLQRNDEEILRGSKRGIPIHSKSKNGLNNLLKVIRMTHGINKPQEGHDIKKSCVIRNNYFFIYNIPNSCFNIL